MLRGKFAWFLGFVVLVVGYAIYDFKSDQWQAEKKSQATTLYPKKSDQVQKIEIQGSKEPLVLERTADGWKFVQPLTEVADQDAVTDFIDGIASEKTSAVAVEGDGIDWERFGLLAGSVRILLTDNLGKLVTFTISGKKNFSGESFLKKDDEKKVYVASSTWAQKMEKRPEDFRDHRLARIHLDEIEGTDLLIGKDAIHLKKQEGTWVSLDQPDLKIDQERIKGLLNKLTGPNFRTLDAHLEGQPGAKPDAKLEAKPVVTWNVHLKEKREWKGELFIGKDQKHIFRSGPPEVTGEISADLANAFLKFNLNEIVKPTGTP